MDKDIYGELINCDEMHTSEVTADNKESYEAAPPEYLAPAAEVTHESSATPNKRYYDGRVRYIDIEEGDGKVNITVSGVPCSLAAKLTGKPFDEKTGRFYDTGNSTNAPWRTLSGRMECAGGEYRYFQYLKGKFSIGAQTAHTREDNVTVNTVQLTYTAAVTEHKFQVTADKICGVRGIFADTTSEGFTAEEQSKWFDEVQMPPKVQQTEAQQTEAQQGN